MKDMANVLEGYFAARAERMVLVWTCPRSEARDARVKVREPGLLFVDAASPRCNRSMFKKDSEDYVRV